MIRERPRDFHSNKNYNKQTHIDAEDDALIRVANGIQLHKYPKSPVSNKANMEPIFGSERNLDPNPNL